jgi:hypothetical protein
MDALLVKVGPPNNLSPEEEVQLAKLLAKRMKDVADVIPDSEARAAHILPDVMVLAKREQEQSSEDSTLKVVSIPKGDEDGAA